MGSVSNQLKHIITVNVGHRQQIKREFFPLSNLAVASLIRTPLIVHSPSYVYYVENQKKSTSEVDLLSGHFMCSCECP